VLRFRTVSVGEAVARATHARPVSSATSLLSSRCSPSKQGAQPPTSGKSSTVSVIGFPQALCTTRCCMTGACAAPAAAVCPGSGTELPTPWRRAVAGGRGSRTSCRKCRPVSAAARGPVSAAAETPSPPDCPRGLPGCQATFWPPVGSATRSNRGCALPSPIRPPRGTVVSTGAAALCPCRRFLSPLYPPRGLCRSLALLDGIGLPLSRCSLSSLLQRLCTVLPQSSCVKARPPEGVGLRLRLARWPPSGLPPPASTGCAARTSRTATAVWQPARAGGRARRASVLAALGSRPCACQTRRGRGLAWSGAPFGG